MKSHTRKLTILVPAVMLLLSTVLSACFTAKKETDIDLSMYRPDEVEEIKIGIFEPLSGDDAEGGLLTEEGIMLAHEERPFILGKKVVLIKSDNKSTVEGAEAAARDLVSQGVHAVIGSYGSSLSIAGGAIFKEAGIPAVGCSPTNPAVTLNNPYYFRVCFIDPFQGSVAANFCKQQLSAKSAIVIVTKGDAYSEGLCETFENSFPNEDLDTEIIDVLTQEPDQTDFSEIIERIAEEKPNVIYAPGSILLSGRLVNAIRSAEINIPIIGGDTWETNDFIKTAGVKNANKQIYFTSHFSAYSDINDISVRFVSKFRKTYKREPNAFGALGYDAYMLLMESIDRATSETPSEIRDSLSDTKLYVGVTGIISLNNDGDAVKDAVVLTIINGRFSFLNKISPSFE